MKISVIVCAYNAENTISRCLKSICTQTYKDLEILVVNDGSKDNTLKIVQKYAGKDKRITIIDQENMGAGLAKNVGLHNVTGDFVTFVDADDWIKKETYQVIADRINQTGCDMVVYNHTKIYKDRIMKRARPIKDEIIDLNRMGRDKYIMRYIISYNHDLGACNKVVKRSILAEYDIGFADNRTMVYDDNLYSLKLICHVGKIAAIAKPYYYYVINEESITGMNNIYNRLAAGYTRLFEKFTGYLRLQNMYSEFETALPLLYYSMVYFGLIRFKHFGHFEDFEVKDSLKSLDEFEEYYKYMQQINKLTVRMNLVTQTLRKVYILKNWQLTGLILLTLIQGKAIAYYALRDDYERLEKFL